MIQFEKNNPKPLEKTKPHPPKKSIKGRRVTTAVVKKDIVAIKGRAKTAISIRLDQDLVDHFKAGGAGWQSRVNSALRKAAGL